MVLAYISSKALSFQTCFWELLIFVDEDVDFFKLSYVEVITYNLDQWDKINLIFLYNLLNNSLSKNKSLN